MKYVDDIKKNLSEAKYLASPDELDDITDKLDQEDIVKIVDEEVVDEKAESKAQQRFMGMVHNCKKTGDCASAAVKKAADSMSAEDAEDFASTKHKGLPNKVEENGDEDYERASREVEYGINPEAGAEDYEAERNVKEEDGERDIDDMSSDVKKLMDKLGLDRFDAIFKRIDKPIEQAEVIAAFAERIGVPRGRLPIILQSMRKVAENKAPKMSKKELVETVLKSGEPKVIKTVKLKELKNK